VSRATGARLKLRRTRTIGTAAVKLATAGRRTVTIRPHRLLRRTAAKAGMRHIAAKLHVALTDAEGQTTSARKALKLRR
jgi:hypothetical protein